MSVADLDGKAGKGGEIMASAEHELIMGVWGDVLPVGSSWRDFSNKDGPVCIKSFIKFGQFIQIRTQNYRLISLAMTLTLTRQNLEDTDSTSYSILRALQMFYITLHDTVYCSKNDRLHVLQNWYVSVDVQQSKSQQAILTRAGH